MGIFWSKTQIFPLSEVNTQQQLDIFSNLYTVGNELGRGEYGVTRVCVENATGTLYASKSTKKKPLKSDNDRVAPQMEVEILQKLEGHPAIINYKGVYEDDDYIHILMELCTGGSLANQIAIKGRHSEHEAAGICLGLLTAVKAYHDAGIIHRDIKPDNVLFSSCNRGQVKLIDFGLSVLDEDGKIHRELVGSPLFIAPEVLKLCYGKEVDIWSSGVILYILLVGSPPFEAATKKDLFEAIMHGHLRFEIEPWPAISSSAKDLVQKMLKRDPRKRITADQSIDHPWITKESENPKSSAPFSAKKVKVNRLYIQSGRGTSTDSCDRMHSLRSM